MDARYADFGRWLVKGSGGWLEMLEVFTRDQHQLSAESLVELKGVMPRLQEIIAGQEKLKEKFQRM